VEPLVALLGGAVAASVGYLIASAQRRGRLAAWRAAAARAGLEGVAESEGGLFGGAFLEGRAGPVRVRFQAYHRGKEEHGTRITISGFGHGAGGLTLRREGLATAFEKRVVGEREIEVGDPRFDEEYYVQGQGPLALALLDQETRRGLGRLLRGRVEVPGSEAVSIRPSLSDGVLEAQVREGVFSPGRERIPDVLAAMLEVAPRLVAPPDVAARIAANLRGEPEPGARLQSLLLLAREFPSHPATREALLAGRSDASPEVRLRASMALGDEGRDTLVALTSDESVGDGVAARAVSALGARIPLDVGLAVLRRALSGDGRPGTAVACLDTLGTAGRAEAEPLAIEALRSDAPPVRAVAARALGRVGTVGAVAALREAMDRGELSRGAGRQAIAEIQSRLAGAAPGQLSLAGAEAGALSLADGEPGRLSLAEVEPEEGSPPAGRQGVRS
jgi:HEAT repeat protein